VLLGTISVLFCLGTVQFVTIVIRDLSALRTLHFSNEDLQTRMLMMSEAHTRILLVNAYLALLQVQKQLFT
jgi:hypothetical protein